MKSIRSWINGLVDQRLDEQFKILVAEARRELQKDTPIGEEYNACTVARTREYVVMDTVTQRPEFIDGWFDLSGVKVGYGVAIDIYVRFPDGRLLKWSTMEQYDTPEDPAVRLYDILAPAGVKIVLRHLAGQDVEVSWFLRRS